MGISWLCRGSAYQLRHTRSKSDHPLHKFILGSVLKWTSDPVVHGFLPGVIPELIFRILIDSYPARQHRRYPNSLQLVKETSQGFVADGRTLNDYFQLGRNPLVCDIWILSDHFRNELREVVTTHPGNRVTDKLSLPPRVDGINRIGQYDQLGIRITISDRKSTRLNSSH